MICQEVSRNTEQLDISMGMIDTLTDYNLVGEQGVDCRNYGVLDGIIEAKKTSKCND